MRDQTQRADLDATMTVSHARPGVVYPLRGPLNKDAGRRLARFGPLIGWTIDLATKNPVVRLAHATSVVSPVCTLLNNDNAPVNGLRCKATGINASRKSAGFPGRRRAVMPQVTVKTQAAEYHLVKPAAAYKDIFSHMLEQCEIACQVRMSR